MLPQARDSLEEAMNQTVYGNTVRRCRERHIVLPTYEQMRHPERIPAEVVEGLKTVGLWDLNSLNLFRIHWKNDVRSGGFGGVNFVEIPRELSGTKARILALVGKYFPTGAHKVGATFGPLVSRLIRGEFDPTTQKAVWPSTGNYCRGGAYDSYLLACPAIAILPEGMSRERFDWLKTVGAEVIATTGCESNVKEIYDKCWELRATRGNEVVILNQFCEFGNPLWHYNVTGPAMEEVLRSQLAPGQRLSGVALSTGSAGTLACADYLKKIWPQMKTCVSEALSCPTLLNNGFGEHRIEGIGDKHIPWIHNVRNTDVAVGIDDEDTIRLLRLFNEPAGREYLKKRGVPADFVDALDLFGISGIGNLLTSIKLIRSFEMSERDVVFTVLTDSCEMYGSRLEELRDSRGPYDGAQARCDYDRCLLGQKTDHVQELGYWDRKRIHNLKYFTWIEQQGHDVAELNAQWFDEDYWDNHWSQAAMWDEEIRRFNRDVAGSEF
jgi:cysteine synthase